MGWVKKTRLLSVASQKRARYVSIVMHLRRGRVSSNDVINMPSLMLKEVWKSVSASVAICLVFCYHAYVSVVFRKY